VSRRPAITATPSAKQIEQLSSCWGLNRVTFFSFASGSVSLYVWIHVS
jgi:hypothetical protein